MESNTKIIELYKAYFSPYEVACILGIDYQKIAAIFRGFKVVDLTRYNRFMLMNEDVVDDIKLNAPEDAKDLVSVIGEERINDTPEDAKEIVDE